TDLSNEQPGIEERGYRCRGAHAPPAPIRAGRMEDARTGHFDGMHQPTGKLVPIRWRILAGELLVDDVHRQLTGYFTCGGSSHSVAHAEHGAVRADHLLPI